MNKKYVLILIPIIILIGLLLHKAFKSPEPKGVVARAFKAVREKDKDAWDKSVNTDALITQTSNIYRNHFQIDGSEDIFLRLEKIVYQLGDMVSGNTEGQLKMEVDDYFSGRRDPLAQAMEGNHFSLVEEFDKINIKDQVINDRKAIVNFTLHHKTYDYDFQFKVMLEKFKDDWKIVNITNFTQVLVMLNDKEKDRKNKAIEEKTNEMLRSLLIENYVGRTKDYWFKKVWPLTVVPISRTEHILKVKNVSDQPITKFGIKLSFRKNGYAVVEKEVIFSQVLDLNKETIIREESYNPFIYGELSEGNVPVMTVLFIEFESGEVLTNDENLDSRFAE